MKHVETSTINVSIQFYTYFHKRVWNISDVVLMGEISVGLLDGFRTLLGPSLLKRPWLHLPDSTAWVSYVNI